MNRKEKKFSVVLAESSEILKKMGHLDLHHALREIQLQFEHVGVIETQKDLHDALTEHRRIRDRDEFCEKYRQECLKEPRDGMVTSWVSDSKKQYTVAWCPHCESLLHFDGKAFSAGDTAICEYCTRSITFAKAKEGEDNE